MKRLLLATGITMLKFGALAQVGSIDWAHCYGGSGYEYANSIVPTHDSGYIIAGCATLIDGQVTGNHGSYDWWIVKINSSGMLQWQKTFGGTKGDQANSIQQTRDGGYIACGYASSNDGNVTGNHGGIDYWVLKLDDTGGIQWQKTYGGSGNDQASSIEQTTDGGYVIGGFTTSVDGDVTNNHGKSDYWLVKTDANGAIQWQKTYGGAGNESASKVKQTKDGGYILSGVCDSTNGDVTGCHGSFDYWLVKVNDLGAIQWERSYGGTGYDALLSMQQTSDNGYILAGGSMSDDGDVTGHHNVFEFDCWIVKTNDTGGIQWQKTFGGTRSDLATSVEQTRDSGYIFTAQTESSDGDVTTALGQTDCWIVKINNVGNIQWQKSIGGSAKEAPLEIHETSSGGYIIGGVTNSLDGDVKDNHDSDIYHSDFWVVKLHGTTTGVESIPAGTTISWYPNPTRGIMILKSTQRGILNITNLQGQQIGRYEVNAGETTISMPAIPPGIYMGRFLSAVSGGEFVFKIVYQ